MFADWMGMSGRFVNDEHYCPFHYRTCGQCSLPFIKQKDLRMHREESHGKGAAGKGKVTGCGWISEKPVLVHQPRKKPQLPPAKGEMNI